MYVSFFAKYDLEKKKQSLRGVVWWQRAWNLHSRSRVRVRACTSYKSLGQPGFYSLIWAYKVRFLGDRVSSNPKKKYLEKTIIQIAVILCESIITGPKSKFTLVDRIPWIYSANKFFFYLSVWELDWMLIWLNNG